MNKIRHYTIPIFVPEQACPNRCVFCNQRNISGMLCQPSDKYIHEIIEQRIATIPFGSEVEIGFFGGNFTGIAQAEQENLLQIVQPYLQKGIISALRVSTRPDYIDQQRLDLLKRFGVRTIEMGAQSLDEEVLQLSGRGHTIHDVCNASRMVLENGFLLGLQMMIGLPGDTLEKTVQTAREIVRLGATSARVYPTLVIKDTELETLYQAGKYVPLTIENAVLWVKEIVNVFEGSGVKIIRIGIHPSEALLQGQKLVAGPFHVSFAELVFTEIWNDLLKPLAEINSGKNLNIAVAEGQVNAAVGYGGKNRDMLKRYFRKVKFHVDPALEGRAYHADIC